MNADPRIAQSSVTAADLYGPLARPAFAPLEPLLERSAALAQVLDDLGAAGDKSARRNARELKSALGALEGSVTMIGQVKAGKTSLVNALIGMPDLLPADVNPWTSVVTSLHLSPSAGAHTNRARFDFFERDEWDRLVTKGGRVGELAGRAGADDELEKVRQQIAEMQEKSRRRLGRKFELLLGQSHDYGYYDADLIERYVCLGDDFEDDTEASQEMGRFADITRAAEVFMHRPEVPVPLCIRDTPGVNDTFMMREQITIRSIRSSRLCVVVLSAHQALSTVDMAIIRLISNVKSREVMIFVNRIDELTDPAAQVPEIAESIRATLRDHNGPEEAEIVFGSAHWALEALAGATALDPVSSAALSNWTDGGTPDPETLWQASGVPALLSAVSERLAAGTGAEALDDIARKARNLAGSIEVADTVLDARGKGGPRPQFDRQDLIREFRRIEVAARDVLDSQFRHLIEDFGVRVDRSHLSFLDRATSALVQHLDRTGGDGVWTYDPTGLRLLLRSAYQLHAKRGQDVARKVLDASAQEIAGLYRKYRLVSDPAFAIEAPAVPRAESPVLLGQTIALDMQGGWWSRWWRKRRGYTAYAEEFFELIRAETDPMAEALKREHGTSIHHATVAALAGFLKEQFSLLCGLAEQADLNEEDVAEIFGVRSLQERRQHIDSAMAALRQFAA